MKKINFKLFLPLFSVPFLLAPLFVKNNKIMENNVERIVHASGEEEVSKQPTIDGELKNGVEVNILPVEWMNFYSDYQQNKDVYALVNYYTSGKENSKPVDVEISWTNTSKDCMYYVLYLANNKDLLNAEMFFTQDESLSFNTLFAGTHYYYQVHAYFKDYTVISRKFDFNTADFYRTINVDGVRNARDIGNKYSEDGKTRIKQGLVYRSERLDLVTQKGKYSAINTYGIRTDLDLREKQTHDVSPLGEQINYVNNASGGQGSPYYAHGGDEGTGLGSSSYQPACRDNLKVFANIDNYPIIFHCAIGRDRTGTLAALLDLLCGVSIAETRLDYCMYVFSSACNTESPLAMIPNINSIFTYLASYVGKDGVSNGDIYDRTEEYCLDIGVTSNEIASIRNILLEEVA